MLFILGSVGSGRKLAKVVPESILATLVVDLLEDRLDGISFMLVTDYNLLQSPQSVTSALSAWCCALAPWDVPSAKAMCSNAGCVKGRSTLNGCRFSIQAGLPLLSVLEVD